MLKFALKNMAIKRVQIILVVLSIVISAGIGVLAFNVANQVDDGITQNAGYYSLIVGPAGSKTQLAMNTMYFTEEPLGTIPYSVLSTLAQDSRVASVIPFAMADSYNGHGVVGTSSAYLSGKELDLTRREYDLLYYLIVNRSLTFSREQLLNNVWGYDFEGGYRTVDTHIRQLRNKLGACADYIKTVHCVGYQFEV